jgi:NAD(P)-dependent dehydrogenase (short-subunit alcohol dehydrogenase family)
VRVASLYEPILLVILKLRPFLRWMDTAIPNRSLRRSEEVRRHRAVPGRQLLGTAQCNARVPATAETLQRGHRQQRVISGACSFAGRTRLLISKAVLFNMTQSLRALLAGQGVTVRAVVLGPVDTDMNRGFEPRPSPRRRASSMGWKKRRRNLSRPRVPVHRRGLAHWRSQGARAPVRSFRAGQRGKSCVTSTT